jgi:divalent metal cation (Fe/Co/Zn/Cd) transporter
MWSLRSKLCGSLQLILMALASIFDFGDKVNFVSTPSQASVKRYWQYALWLAFFTIFYNLVEGLVSVYFGTHDEALTLFGFGLDSFIEVMSGIGVLAMVIRIRKNKDTSRSQFEQTALRITGIAFYILAVGLAATAIYNFVTGHKPSTTLPGFIISLISIAVMWILVVGKRKVGHSLNSAPILADSNCTLTCIYMSIVLLASSLIYRFTGFGFVDSLGAIGLIYFSVTEGMDAFKRASNLDDDCCDDKKNRSSISKAG